MAAPRRPPVERGIRGLPATSPGDIPSGAGKPGQDRITGQEDGAEPDGGHGAGRGTWPQREGMLCPPAAKAGLVASLWWPKSSWQPGEAPSDSEEARDGDSLVSSGRLSGCSGGHESCRPWQERPPPVRGPPRQPRTSDPRLERLRDRIRAQARWQASCGSLGTSVPSSASRLCRPSWPAPQRKVRRAAQAPPAPAHPGFSIQRAAESRVKEKASPGQGIEPFHGPRRQASVPRGKGKRTKSCSCKKEKAPTSPSLRRAAKSKGDSKKVQGAEGRPGPARTRSPASTCSDPQAPTLALSQASRDPPATIENAMSILQDLRQQIQAGLELAQDPLRRQRTEPGRQKLRLQDPAAWRQWGSLSTPSVQVPFSKRPWATTAGKGPPLEGASSLPARQPWSASAPWENSPRWAWAAERRDVPFQRPTSPQGRPAARPQRPWSASAGQVSRLDTAWDPSEDWDAPARSPWSPADRRSAPAPQPCSASVAQSTGAPDPGGGSAGRPPGRKKEKEEGLASCRKPRSVPGKPHSAEAQREFLPQGAPARHRQVLEEKAAAARAREQREQRLREVLRPQREAAHGRAAPVVSRTAPGIVTFVPRPAPSGGAEATSSPDSPVLEWSKVTSGVVLGDQEAQGSFCLFLNKALNHPDNVEKESIRDGWDGASLLVPASSPLGPLAIRYPSPGLCIYLDSSEAGQPGVSSSPHLQYKRARLQALESMASVLKQRIDVLTAKLHKPEATEAPRDPASDPLPRPGAALPAPACPGDLVSHGETGPPQGGTRGWADMQARPLLSPTCFPDGEALWEPQQLGTPWNQHTSRLSGFLETGHAEPERWLARNSSSFHAVSPFLGSSLSVPPMLDPLGGSPRLEERLAARGAGLLKMPPTRTCGERGAGGRRVGDPSTAHLAELQQQPVSFLESLKLQQQQEQVLALLRRQAELEVWETQRALDGLLFKHRLQQRMRRHKAQAGPETALEPEQLPARGRLGQAALLNPGTVGPRAHFLRGEAAVPSGVPEPQGSQLGKFASAGPVQEAWRPDTAPSQLPQARLCLWDPWGRQDSTYQRHREVSPSAGPGAPDGLTLQLLRQSRREEEMRAQHQAELLRLRGKALQEKGRAELAWLAHRRGCLESDGDHAAVAALAEQQQQVLANLWWEQKEIQHLRNTHLWAHRERKLLLQLQEGILSLQQSTARLRQDLWAPTMRPQVGTLTWLEAQSSSPEAKAAREGGCKTSWQPEGQAQDSSCPQTQHRPGDPTSSNLWRSPQGRHVTHLPAQQESVTPPWAPSAVDAPWQPPRPAWGEDTLAVSLISQDPVLCHQRPGSPEGRRARSRPSPTQSSEAEGGVSAAQLGVQEMKPPPGDPQTDPSPGLAEDEVRALTRRLARDGQGQSWHSPGRDGPHGPREANQVAGGTGSRTGSEGGLDSAGSPPGQPHEVDSWPSQEQRRDTCWRGDPSVPCSCLEATQLAAAPAPVAPEGEVSPSQAEGSPLPGSSPSVDWGSESLPGTCLGSSEASTFSGASSAGSASSLESFQKVSATLVHVSGSSVSPTDPEEEDIPDTDLSGSWEDVGCPLSETLPGVPTDMAVAGSPGLPLPDTPSARSGSELSEASSEIWREDHQEDVLGPGAGPASGGSPLAEGLSDLGNGGAPSAILPPLGLGLGLEVSGTSERPSKGKPVPNSPAASSTASPSEASSTSDLDAWLSFPLGASVSEEAELGGAGETGHQEGPQDTDRRLSPPGQPSLTMPKPEVPTSLQAPTGDPGEAGAPSARGDAPLLLAGSVVAEILSPVDEVLSYGSADLSSTHRAATSPPPSEPALPVESGAEDAPSEDSPSPPEELTFLGEDASLASDELSSLSEGRPLGAPSPELLGLCLGGAGQGGSLVEDAGDGTSPVAGSKAGGSRESDPIGCLGSPTCRGADIAPEGLPRSSVQPPTPSRVVCVSGEGLLRPSVADNREHTGHPSSGTWGAGAPALGAEPRAGVALAWGSRGEPWDVVPCSEAAEDEEGLARLWTGHGEHLGAPLPLAGPLGSSDSLAEGQDPGEVLGEGVRGSLRLRPAALAAPPPGQLTLVASGLAGSLEEAAGGLGSQEDGQPRPGDPRAMETLPGHAADSCPAATEGHCVEKAEAVDLMSTQLTRRILCDTLATLSELAGVGSPRAGEAP
ncbi:coiled-coil domain-containing protein 187 isoform X3 [Choloepus didactylus]|uniref:coiled-coil domain-containing protein 187 isoform X3 n=1 Tax=Choloepus didactylus TaxID=27675 RepID=UPI00189EE32D|nr:coiled-coil domain-containing protein 187 isoform X3 [Choloepus didactylus]